MFSVHFVIDFVVEFYIKAISLDSKPNTINKIAQITSPLNLKTTTQKYTIQKFS